MHKLPKLAIVGRPNVGKSALFNCICNKRVAIVDEAEGITRDRLYAIADYFGHPFEVIDTGGIDPRSDALFNEEVKRQAEIAIEEADSLVMVVDARIGVTALDKEIAHILLRTKKPLCLAVNKIDNLDQEHLMHEFRSLGISKMIAVSATQRWQIADLLELAFKTITFEEESEEASPNSIKVAIVGRPNVGKSSLLNTLLDDERSIVSPIPGTTRDSIDSEFQYQDQIYTLIDTAGIRRKRSEKEAVDKFALIRTDNAIERADICLLILDAQQGLTVQDKKIANRIEEAGKGCILLFNKWDLVKGFRMEHCLRGIENEATFLKYCPKVFISAKTGRNLDKIVELLKEVHSESQKRISTHQLNKFVEECIQKNHPPMIMGKRLRIYYMAQVEIQPPKFILFVNFPNLMTDTYKKYLYNQFRLKYQFTGVPILIYLKGKKRDKERRTGKKEEGSEFRRQALEPSENDDFESEGEWEGSDEEENFWSDDEE